MVPVGELLSALRAVGIARDIGYCLHFEVYDSAAWSVIGPLSAASIDQGGHPVAFPDFTDGQWMTNDRIFDENGEY